MTLGLCQRTRPEIIARLAVSFQSVSAGMSLWPVAIRSPADRQWQGSTKTKDHGKHNRRDTAMNISRELIA
jgi:hypothetical protein